MGGTENSADSYPSCQSGRLGRAFQVFNEGQEGRPLPRSPVSPWHCPSSPVPIESWTGCKRMQCFSLVLETSFLSIPWVLFLTALNTPTPPAAIRNSGSRILRWGSRLNPEPPRLDVPAPSRAQRSAPRPARQWVRHRARPNAASTAGARLHSQSRVPLISFWELRGRGTARHPVGQVGEQIFEFVESGLWPRLGGREPVLPWDCEQGVAIHGCLGARRRKAASAGQRQQVSG